MLFSQRYHRALLEQRLSVDLFGEARMPKLEGKERDTVLNYLEATFPPRAGDRRRLAESVSQSLKVQSSLARRGLPQGAMLGRWRHQGAAVAAIAAVEFGLGEQRADFRLAAGGQ